MVQGTGGSRALPAARKTDTFVFDLQNALRIWLSEKVTQCEIKAQEAQDAIRRMDADKVADKAIEISEDQIKLWLGPIKDGRELRSIGQKLVDDFGRWWKVPVEFKKGASGDVIIIKGWPAGRKTLSGTRYRVSNPKVIEMQIGRPGIMASAKESAKFGVYLVMAVDVIQFARDRNFAHLLGSLTVDIPSVLLASAIGTAVGALAAGTVVVGTIALGPALLAFGVGVAVGAGLFWLDKHFELTDRVTAAYERGLTKLEKWWRELGSEAHKRWNEFINSGAVQDLESGFLSIGQRMGHGDNAMYMMQSLM